MVPGGHGIEAHQAGLLYSKEQVDAVITEQAAEIARLREALGDAIELAHGVSFSDSPIMASWGQRVEVKARAALDAQP